MRIILMTKVQTILRIVLRNICIWHLHSRNRNLPMTTHVLTEVYFIRHGIAEARHSGQEDATRSLTEKGITKTERIAQKLFDLGLQFDTLLSSPLVRAWQTAEILQSAGLANRLEDCLSLSPDGQLSDWLNWLSHWQSVTPSSLKTNRNQPPSLAIVGHEPNLSQWAQQLTGSHTGNHWILKKAGIIGLQVPTADRAIGHSQLFWLSPPRFLR